MNVSVENFGATIKPLDLTLYVGVILVVYVLFKEKIHDMINKLKENFASTKIPPSIIKDYFSDNTDNADDFDDRDPFFSLVRSWKHTRDLAEEVGAEKAVEIADQMFPYLAPQKEEDQ